MTREDAIYELRHHLVSIEDCVGLKDSFDALTIAIKALEQEPNRQIEDYENEIEDLHNRLDIAEYDKERLREEVTNLEAKIKALEQEPCDDCVSREAVIKLVKKGEYDITGKTDNEMFLEEVNKLPSVQPNREKHDAEVINETVESIWGKPPCDDAISRQAVLDCQQIFYDNAGYKTYYVDIEDIKDLPPVYPQPKTGHWIYIANSGINGLKICKCSNCEKKTYGSPKFCPNCGARMESEE